MSCCAVGCDTTRRNCDRKGLTMHKLPMGDPTRLEKWLKICKPGTNLKNGSLCSRHFDRSQFLLTPQRRFRKLNRRTAVPFLLECENQQSSLEKSDSSSDSSPSHILPDSITLAKDTVIKKEDEQQQTESPSLEEKELHQESHSSLRHSNSDGNDEESQASPFMEKQTNGSVSQLNSSPVAEVGDDRESLSVHPISNTSPNCSGSGKRNTKRKYDGKPWGSYPLSNTYSRKKSKLLTQNLKLQSRIEELEAENQLLKRNFPGGMSATARQIFLNEMRNHERPERGRRYEKSVRNFALKLSYLSTAAYLHVSSVFSLPTPRTLRRDLATASSQRDASLTSVKEKNKVNPENYGPEWIFKFSRLTTTKSSAGISSNQVTKSDKEFPTTTTRWQQMDEEVVGFRSVKNIYR